MFNIVIVEPIKQTPYKAELDFIPSIGMHLEFDFLPYMVEVVKVTYHHNEKEFVVITGY